MIVTGGQGGARRAHRGEGGDGDKADRKCVEKQKISRGGGKRTGDDGQMDDKRCSAP